MIFFADFLSFLAKLRVNDLERSVFGHYLAKFGHDNFFGRAF